MIQPDSKTELVEAVRELYRVFRPYRTRRHPEGCTCCVSDEDNRRLMAKPLEELTAEDLDRYSMKALTTWGEVEDLKHFLPRLLELALVDDYNGFQVEVLFGKLRLGKWQSWPVSEQEAVTLYFHAIWKLCLESESGTDFLDDILCALGCADCNLAPFLHMWVECHSQLGYTHLLQFLDKNASAALKRRSLSNGFWSDSEVQMRQVLDWVADPQTLNRLEEIFEANSEADYADTLVGAIDRMAAFQKWLQSKDQG